MLTVVVPIIIQNTITNVVSLLDNVMVGQVGTLPMSAVAIINQLLFVFNLSIFGGMAGAGIFAAQFAGSGDDRGVQACFRLKLMIGAVLLTLATAILALLPDRLIGLYLAADTAEADAAATLTYGWDYLRLMLPGLVPFVITQAYASTLRELGETRLPMLAGAAAIGVNLVFNWLLIFGNLGFPRLGVTGAAAATTLSRFVEAAIIVLCAHRRRYPFLRKAYTSLYVPAQLLKDVGKKGSPLLVNEILWSGGLAVLLQCWSVRGLEAVAAANIASTVSNMFNVVFLSMGSAVAILVGQELGAGRTEGARDMARKLTAATVLACVPIGLSLFLLAPVIPGIYDTEESVRQLASGFLRVTAVLMPVYAFSNNCYFVLRSGGRTMITFFFDSGFTWCVSVPAAWLLTRLTGLPILPIYMTVQGLDVLKAAAGFLLMKKGIWIRNIVQEMQKTGL